ncbi:hypothetical protein ACOSQ2_020846 [Xanthoceras sorbifolium]
MADKKPSRSLGFTATATTSLHCLPPLPSQAFHCHRHEPPTIAAASSHRCPSMEIAANLVQANQPWHGKFIQFRVHV